MLIVINIFMDYILWCRAQSFLQSTCNLLKI